MLQYRSDFSDGLFYDNEPIMPSIDILIIDIVQM